ncbi:MAG: phage tail assembly protein [Candidatus Improbicoccus pseudotrichonymphae]|uniref:Phage tail assembly protein n=1 Tax=Candidatus Improbicoccus pseudotrichonymphae TaxID=3033792 RepID=A0AA48L124_9FIRM|nr:MAG: phage tail assembly protein [Candidatus Improbicoccus pseudotrichonymphae]
MLSFETKYNFELPKGYVDSKGEVHQRGIMRLANASDEIIPLNDPRVKLNPSYLSVLILERVIIELGTIPKINSSIIESLFTADMTYLQDFYQKINSIEPQMLDTICPNCGSKFSVNEPFFAKA